VAIGRLDHRSDAHRAHPSALREDPQRLGSHPVARREAGPLGARAAGGGTPGDFATVGSHARATHAVKGHAQLCASGGAQPKLNCPLLHTL
jgi:hypothetical protein